MKKKTNQVIFRPMNPRNLALLAAVYAMLSFSAQAQITVNRNFTVNQDIADRGQYVSTYQIAHAGLATISDVNVGLVLSGASGSSLRLGQMYATVTVGSASEGSRTAVLLNRPGVSNTNAFGSSVSALNVTFDDSSANNIYNLTSGAGTYAADGRIGVNPYGTRVAYDASQITAGLSALNGNWSDNWSLLVADAQAGNRGRLDSWSLSITGTAASTGTLDVGAGGTITATGAGTEVIGATVSSGGTGANAISLGAASGQELNLSGGISGSGGFNKTGNGVLRIGNSGDFTGTLQAMGGKVVVDGTLNSASTLQVGSGATVGGTGTVGALEIASGGTIGPGNSPGTLNANSAVWNGGAHYQVEIKSFPQSLQEGATSSTFLGSAGTGWDYLNVATTLTINATATNKFLIDVTSLLANNTSGDASGFLPQYDYTMAIATAAGGIIGFDSSYFGINLDGFTNSRNYAPWMSQSVYAPGSFNVSLSGDNKTLYLNYARAIPEPNSAALVLVGLGAAWLRRRRRGLVGGLRK